MSVVSWLNGVGINLDLLNECDILFGLLHTRSPWLLLNHIIIMGKQVIYQSRLKKCKPLLTHLKNKLKSIEGIECNIAIRNNRQEIHNKKWHPLENISLI